jgi:hypothetical protein
MADRGGTPNPCTVAMRSSSSSFAADANDTERPSSHHSAVAISRNLQNALAIFISPGVLHSGSNSAGEHTKMLKHFARDVATFNRFKL